MEILLEMELVLISSDSVVLSGREAGRHGIMR